MGRKEFNDMIDIRKQAVPDSACELRANEERELDDLMDRLVDENIEALEELAK